MIKLPNEKQKFNNNTSFKTLGTPRDGKKLIIFTLNNLLIDPEAPLDYFPGRPYLHIFLAKVYEMYDIGIWSMNSIKETEIQLAVMDMNRCSGYEILFCANDHHIIPQPSSSRHVLVKNLDIVWKIFPEHSTADTVLCDYDKDQFILYPYNGILLSPYFYVLYDQDDELLKLLAYLTQYLVTWDDVTDMDHMLWPTILTCRDY